MSFTRWVWWLTGQGNSLSSLWVPVCVFVCAFVWVCMQCSAAGPDISDDLWMKRVNTVANLSDYWKSGIWFPCVVVLTSVVCFNVCLHFLLAWPLLELILQNEKRQSPGIEIRAILLATQSSSVSPWQVKHIQIWTIMSLRAYSTLPAHLIPCTSVKLHNVMQFKAATVNNSGYHVGNTRKKITSMLFILLAVTSIMHD